MKIVLFAFLMSATLMAAPQANQKIDLVFADGKIIKNAKILATDPHNIIILCKDGVTTVVISALNAETKIKLGYDPKADTDYIKVKELADKAVAENGNKTRNGTETGKSATAKEKSAEQTSDSLVQNKDDNKLPNIDFDNTDESKTVFPFPFKSGMSMQQAVRFLDTSQNSPEDNERLNPASESQSTYVAGTAKYKTKYPKVTLAFFDDHLWAVLVLGPSYSYEVPGISVPWYSYNDERRRKELPKIQEEMQIMLDGFKDKYPAYGEEIPTLDIKVTRLEPLEFKKINRVFSCESIRYIGQFNEVIASLNSDGSSNPVYFDYNDPIWDEQRKSYNGRVEYYYVKCQRSFQYVFKDEVVALLPRVLELAKKKFSDQLDERKRKEDAYNAGVKAEETRRRIEREKELSSLKQGF